MTRRGPQGPHTFAKRWRAERERSPEIAAIAVGATLEVRFPKEGSAAKDHKVTCCEGYWLYEGKQYPTLYMIVEAIAGAHERPRGDTEQATKRTANFSALRFFNLKEYTS